MLYQQLINEFQLLKISSFDTIEDFFTTYLSKPVDKLTWIFVDIEELVFESHITDESLSENIAECRYTLLTKKLSNFAESFNKTSNLIVLGVSSMRTDDINVINSALNYFNIQFTNHSVKLSDDKVLLENGILFSKDLSYKPSIISNVLQALPDFIIPSKIIYLTPNKNQLKSVNLVINDFIFNSRINIQHELHFIKNPSVDHKTLPFCKSILNVQNERDLTHAKLLKPIEQSENFEEDYIFQTGSVVNTLNKLEPVLASEKTWVIFDIDETILEQRSYERKSNLGLTEKVWSQYLIEEELPITIADLCDKLNNVGFFCLTARAFIKHVRNTNNFIESNNLRLNMFQSCYENTAFRINVWRGVVYTNGSNKKYALDVLLSTVKQDEIPERIIFFEDRSLLLKIAHQDVENFNKRHGTNVKFTGFAVDFTMQHEEELECKSDISQTTKCNI